MKKKLIALSGLGIFTPFLAFAQNSTVCTLGTLQGIICKIQEILNSVIPVLIVLGVVYFIWGIITYVIASDEEAKTSGRNRIIWGIIGLLVIVAVWGLVGIVSKTFGLGGPANITIPAIPPVGNGNQ